MHACLVPLALPPREGGKEGRRHTNEGNEVDDYISVFIIILRITGTHQNIPLLYHAFSSPSLPALDDKKKKRV